MWASVPGLAEPPLLSPARGGSGPAPLSWEGLRLAQRGPASPTAALFRLRVKGNCGGGGRMWSLRLWTFGSSRLCPPHSCGGSVA